MDKTQSSYHHGDLTNALKKNALKIIKAEGITHLTLRDLAAKCGVSATAVYRHYKSKNDLLANLAEEGFYKLRQASLQATLETKNTGAKIQKLGLSYIHFALQHPIYFRLMFGPYVDKTDSPLLLKAYDEGVLLLRREIEHGVEQGIMVGNVDSLTRTAWAVVHGTASLLLDKQFPRAESEKIAIETMSIAARGLFRVD